MDYVAGFVFNEARTKVVLIKKLKPEWQAGFLNGVGGKMEEQDKGVSHIAMSREFKEEAGVYVKHLGWDKFCTLVGDFGNVHFFRLFDNYAFLHAETTEEEEIVKIYLSNLTIIKTIPNLQWLIPMALEDIIHKATVEVSSDPTD